MISPSLQHIGTDVDSLHFSSKFYPSYMVGDNGLISVFPAPGSDPNVFKVYYGNNSPEETDGTAFLDDVIADVTLPLLCVATSSNSSLACTIISSAIFS